MTDERALMAALHDANPVPDPDALIENRGSADPGAVSQRNQTMPSTQLMIDTTQPSANPKRRRPLVIAISATAIIVAAVAVAFLRPVSGEVAAPVEVATAFFDAINQNDADAWWALHDENATVFGEGLAEASVQQSYQDYFDWRTTVESRFENLQCSEVQRPDGEDVGVLCSYVWQGAIQDRFGVTINGTIQMDVRDGRIVNVTSDNPDFSVLGGFPARYLTEHHGAAFEDVCGGGPGAFNGGRECALLYMDNLDAMGAAWDAEQTG